MKKHLGIFAGSGMRLQLLFVIGAVAAHANPNESWFEESRGRTSPGVQYISQGAGQRLELSAKSVRWVGPAADVEMRFGNPSRIAAMERLPGVTNYLLGADPSKWLRAVPHYGRVQYTGAWPGVDAIFYTRDGRWEYDFVVAPGADPSTIQLQFHSAEAVRIDVSGDLMIGPSLRHKRPVAYQMKQGRRVLVESQFQLWTSSQVRFALGPYDQSLPLVIDPVMSTALRGNGNDFLKSVSWLGGDIFVGGSTASTNVTTSGAFQSQSTGVMNLVARYSTAGQLLYATYLGLAAGLGTTMVSADSQNRVCVAGTVYQLPAVAAWQPAFGGGNSDAFVARLNAAGWPDYATYLGGSSDETGAAVFNADGVCIAGGKTRSGDFPTSLNNVMLGSSDAFLASFSSTGSLIYSRLIGGDGDDMIQAITYAKRPTGPSQLYLAGSTTNSYHFPLVGALRTSTENSTDAFVMRLEPSGLVAVPGIVFSTLLGGLKEDSASSVGTDQWGNMYVGGSTESLNFTGAQNSRSGPSDGFVSKINANGTMAWSSYVGGSGQDDVTGIAVTPNQEVVVAGSTNSPNINPISSIVLLRGSVDAFYVRLSSTGYLANSQHLGGISSGANDRDLGNAIAYRPVDWLNPARVVIAGWTTSADFYVTYGLPPNGATADGFLMILTP